MKQGSAHERPARDGSGIPESQLREIYREPITKARQREGATDEFLRNLKQLKELFAGESHQTDENREPTRRDILDSL